MLRRELFAVLIGLVTCGSVVWSQTEKLRVIVRRNTVPQYSRNEIAVIGVGDYERPGDPAEIKLDAVLQSPSGKTVVVPGFAMHETRTVKQKNRPKFVATGPWRWRVRYMPDEVGKYTGIVKITTPEEIRKSEEFSFSVSPSDSSGIIRVARHNPWAFEYSDGTAYIPIGQNLSWASCNDRLAKYNKWLNDMAANGCNFIRIWLGADWCFGIQGNEPYRYNEDAAELMDRVLELCEARGIAVKLCFGNNIDGYLGKNDGPFKQCENKLDFLTKDSAKTQWKALQRYCVARYGASTSIFAWEMWNEMVSNFGDINEVAAWTQEMCRHVKSIDSHSHLSGNSTGKLGLKVYTQPAVDFTQYHRYGGADHKCYETPQTADEALFSVYDGRIRQLRRLGKPVLLAECGLTRSGWGPHPVTTPGTDGPKDKNGYAFHEALWIGFFDGGAGSGQTWWWDSMVEQWNYYGQFQPLADFVSDIPLNEVPLPPSQGQVAPENLRCYVRQNDRIAVAWVINENDDWYSLVVKDKEPEPVSGAILTLTGLEDGQYKADFMNPWTGDTVTKNAQVDKGELTLVLPDFKIDTAVKLKKTR